MSGVELPWRPIAEVALWDVAVVTDGEHIAMSQKAEADDGAIYWAVDPEDGLDWEPTHYVPHLGQEVSATPTTAREAIASAIEVGDTVTVNLVDLASIRTSMAILQHSCESCAVNHYGSDFETFGMPGWLADTSTDLAVLTAALTGQSA